MADLTFLVNYVDAAVAYATTPADYIEVDLVNDYLIWSESLADLMTHEPTVEELNENAAIIDESLAVTVAKCLLMDYSHNVGGSYYTHLIKGMSDNKRYVFCFSFDDATATEPQLEAWDDDGHDSIDLNVLGAGTPNDTMVKGVCTTNALPGAGWTGSPIAGSNVILLNAGDGALSGAKDLYANIKIVIPAAYSVPAAENFILTVRHTYA